MILVMVGLNSRYHWLLVNLTETEKAGALVSSQASCEPATLVTPSHFGFPVQCPWFILGYPPGRLFLNPDGGVRKYTSLISAPEERLSYMESLL
jgi:hypothetical protein